MARAERQPIHARISRAEMPCWWAATMPPVPAVAPAVARAAVFLSTGALASGTDAETAVTVSSFFRMGSLPAMSCLRSASPFVPPFHAFTQPRKSLASANRLRFFQVQNAAQISGCISSLDAMAGFITAGRPVRRSRAA